MLCAECIYVCNFVCVHVCVSATMCIRDYDYISAFKRSAHITSLSNAPLTSGKESVSGCVISCVHLRVIFLAQVLNTFFPYSFAAKQISPGSE